MAGVVSRFVHTVLVSIEWLELPVLNLGKTVRGTEAVGLNALGKVAVNTNLALTVVNTDVKVDASSLVPPTHVVAVLPVVSSFCVVLSHLILLGPNVEQILEESDIPEQNPGGNAKAEEDTFFSTAESSTCVSGQVELGVNFFAPRDGLMVVLIFSPLDRGSKTPVPFGTSVGLDSELVIKEGLRGDRLFPGGESVSCGGGCH